MKSVRACGSARSRAANSRASCPCRVDGRTYVAHLVIEHDQPRRIALVVNREIEQRSRDEARIIHLFRRARRILHRVARVQQHRELAVGFAAITLQIAAFRAREQVPVHVAQIVSRRVGAVLGKLLAEAEVGRSVQPGDKAVHDGLRHQVQRRNPRQHRRIEESLHQFSFGRGTVATSRLRISSVSIDPTPRENSEECDDAAPEQSPT